MPAWVQSAAHQAIIRALIEARKSAGLTQRDIATSLKKSPSFVGKVEAIERNLSVLEFVAWTKAIGIDGGDLLRSVASSFEDKIEI
jgi:transcriptional regulator with XRE-family HTH domain